MTTTPETTPKERQNFGFDVGPMHFGRAGIIARPTERSMTGNFILEAGPALRNGGWTKSLHIVLTPDEAREFHAALGQLLETQP
jgi:hypothetical protein